MSLLAARGRGTSFPAKELSPLADEAAGFLSTPLSDREPMAGDNPKRDGGPNADIENEPADRVPCDDPMTAA